MGPRERHGRNSVQGGPVSLAGDSSGHQPGRRCEALQSEQPAPLSIRDLGKALGRSPQRPCTISAGQRAGQAIGIPSELPVRATTSHHETGRAESSLKGPMTPVACLTSSDAFNQDARPWPSRSSTSSCAGYWRSACSGWTPLEGRRDHRPAPPAGGAPPPTRAATLLLVRPGAHRTARQLCPA